MSRQPADSIDRIRVVHEDQAAYDRVKLAIKLHFCRITFEEFDMAKISRLGTCRCSLHRGRSAVGANNLPGGPNHAGG